ncbi:MAG: DNA polymerase/3'-5' exonuclease PolX [Planctomycetota bacterium]
MENAQIADIFEEISDLLELKDANEFRIRSYQNAARSIRDMSQRLADLAEEGEDLSELPNIGEKTAEKIHEILEKGTCRRLEDLRDELPQALTEVMKVPGVGPRKAMKIHRELDVDDLDDLRQACRDGKVRTLEGFGEKTEEKILDGIKTLETTAGRVSLKEAGDHVRSLSEWLDGVDEVDRYEVAGSFRRRKETVGDLDILIQASDRKAAGEAIVEFEGISNVDSHGAEKITVHLTGGLQVDFRFFEPRNFGAALMYFTGSKAHNIHLRKIAVDRGWKLNEYGLFKDDDLLAGKDEEAMYHRLNLAWVPPEMREDRGEVDAAAEDRLPELIEHDEVRGDLQCHTTASDGNNSIEEMARSAKDFGFSYLAITDHSKRVTMARGLDNDKCRKHAEEIRKMDGKLDRFWLLAGVEVDILKSGKLDLDEDVLAELDWVIASIHYDRNLSEEKMTERYLSAIRSGVVHAIAHPLGRIVGKREAMAIHFEKVAEACAEHDVLLEINAQPDRLDLPDTYVQQAREMGCSFSFGTDAHKTDAFDFLRYATDVARRGWLEAGDVVNTLTIPRLRRRLRRK